VVPAHFAARRPGVADTADPSNVADDVPGRWHEDLTTAEDDPDGEPGTTGIEGRRAEVDGTAAVPALDGATAEAPRGAPELERSEDRRENHLVGVRIGRRGQAANR
jgi:hypothetical protein